MKSTIGTVLAMLVSACLLPVQAEILEEIVAYVDSDIITKSEFENEEQMLLAEAYREFTGEELDLVLQERREGLLQSMIDRKVLLHRAERLYDVERMADVYYDGFRGQQGFDDDAEFEAWLDGQGLNIEEFKDRLVEMFAPDDVIRIEVGRGTTVGDKEVDAYYEAHPEAFKVPGQVTIREIVLLAETDADKDKRRPELATILERLATEDFATVAGEVSEAGTAAEGGLLGPLTRGDLSWQLATLAFEQQVGEFGFLETTYGFHLLKVESRTEDSVKPLEEIREQLRGYLENEKYVTKLNEFMEKARSEAEWCVKDKYMHRLPPQAPRQPCSSL
jgi:parvulin-like peptidyl-prolyl isomerase